MEGPPLGLAVATFATSTTTIIIAAITHGHPKSGRLRAVG